MSTSVKKSETKVKKKTAKKADKKDAPAAVVVSRMKAVNHLMHPFVTQGRWGSKQQETIKEALKKAYDLGAGGSLPPTVVAKPAKKKVSK